MTKVNKWYSIKAIAVKNASGESQRAIVNIHDEIGGWGVSASDFREDLAAIGEVSEVEFSIHSPGGSVIDGWAMYNMIRGLKVPTVARIQGYAASMATVIALAADRVEMPRNSYFMIHNPSVGNMGDAESMRQIAEVLDMFEADIVKTYVEKSGKPEAEIRDLMAKETWLNGEQALELGLVDGLTDALEVAAVADSFRPHAEQLIAQFGDLPVNLTDAGAEEVEETEETEPAAEVEAAEATEEPAATVETEEEEVVETPEPEAIVESVPVAEATEASGGTFMERVKNLIAGNQNNSGEVVALRGEVVSLNTDLAAAVARASQAESKILAVETERDGIAAELLRMKNEHHEVHELIAQAGFAPADAEELPTATADDGSSADIYERYQAIEDPAKRKEFFNAHKVSIWEARDKAKG